MTKVLYTVDTELSPALHMRGISADENLQIAVFGRVSDGVWGITYQIERLNAHKLKGVFFVEALCAYALGADVLKRIIEPILRDGHDVQLHIHTEWLNWISKDIVGARRGRNIADFNYQDQRRILQVGLDALVAAGAPRPIAFRAGNYGASDLSLEALASLGLSFDSSYNYPYLGRECRISSKVPLNGPTDLSGVVEIPITFFYDYPGHTRPLQLCAASASELKSIIRQCVSRRRSTAVIVSHGFELLNFNRTRANRMLLKRFDDYCSILQSHSSEIRSVNFLELGQTRESHIMDTSLNSNIIRTSARMLQQGIGTLRYDRR